MSLLALTTVLGVHTMAVGVLALLAELKRAEEKAKSWQRQEDQPPSKTGPEAGLTLLPADVDIDGDRQTYYTHQQVPGMDRHHLVPPVLRRLDHPAAAFVYRVDMLTKG